MAPNPAITASLLTLALLAGCLGGEAPDAAPEAQDVEAPSDASEAPAQPPAADGPTDPFAGCPRGLTNYGTALGIGDLYVYDHRGGNLYVVYEESNGLANLQTEEECAKPDTKIAEVPEPALADLLKSLLANA